MMDYAVWSRPRFLDCLPLRNRCYKVDFCRKAFFQGIYSEQICVVGRNGLARRQVHLRCRAVGTEPSVEPSPEDVMRMLAMEYGVRLYEETAGGRVRGSRDEEDDEEESWDEVVSELGNPLDMRPARVGLMDDLDDDSTLPTPRPAGPPTTAPAEPPDTAASGMEASAAGGAVAGGAVAGAPSSPPPGPSLRSSYLDPASLPRITRGELLDLTAGLARPPQAASSSSSGSSSSSSQSGRGEGLDSYGGRPRVVLVDVRETEAEGLATPLGDASASQAPVGACGPTLRLPLSGLRRPQAEQLAEAADYVVVLGTGDHRGEQAVVRLTKVYGMRRVMLYEDKEN